MARALASLLGMPPAGDSIPVELEITNHGSGQRWVRTFGTSRLATTQYPAPNGLLAERFGLIELRFRLEVVGDSLVYSQKSAFFCVLHKRWPLPRWISPKVEAKETALDSRRTHVTVTVSAPYIGLITAYDGELEIPLRSP
jgi:hypothetical protein